MATKRDYYEVLGVPKSANADEVKRKPTASSSASIHPHNQQGGMPSAEAKI